MIRLKNFIGGEFEGPINRGHFISFDPSRGEAHLEIPDSDASDVARAVEAAKAAFPSWSETSLLERSRLLHRVADLIDERADELAAAESRDQGKPISLAKSMDIPRSALNFRFFAGVLMHQIDSASRIDQSTFNYVTRRPIGVAGLISPWNLPLYLLTWKIAPAIAFGNTCVAKPSELTSYTAFLLCEILIQAGIPKGVVNIVFGQGSKAGSALVAHPDVPLISFTGGTVTGRSISSVAAPMFKKLSLELGGKNANVIFDDADFEQAVATSIRSSFLNQGEICLCGSRLFVQRGIFDRFAEEFVSRARALKVGDPSDPETFMGPLVSHDHMKKVESFLELARDEKAMIACGGKRPKLEGDFAYGYFLEPTVILNPNPESKLQSEEIFGPVVTVTAFDTEEDVIKLANSTRYGLSASIWTTNLGRAHRVAGQLHAGTVWINTWMNRDLRMPFGGVKESGVGSEGQEGSLEFFTEAKTICVKHS